MARQEKRTRHNLGGAPDRRADLLYDLSNTHLRAKRVGRYRNRIAAADTAFRQMRPEALVERPPVPSVDVHHEALRLTVRKKQVNAIARRIPVGGVQPGAAALCQLVAETPRRFGPGLRPTIP